MTTVDISVVVPCFNNEPYLRRCLEALFSQTYPRDRYEVILVDNNSTDQSLQVAREFPGLILLKEGIQSSYAARNLGCQKAKGRILAFTDSDCEVGSTWLEMLSSPLSEPGTALVLGAVRSASESFGLKMAADYEAEKVAYVCAQRDPRLYCAYTNNLAVRREVFERCGPFIQLARGADVVFLSRVLDAFGTGSVGYVREARLRHLEIRRVWHWWRKLRTYGRSGETYRIWSRTQPLSFRQRLAVMRLTIERNQYSGMRAASLGAILAVGLAAFESGRLRQRLFRSAAGP